MTWRSRPVRWAVVLGIAGLTTLLALGGFVVERYIQGSFAARRSTDHSYAVILAIQDLRISVARGQSALRAYVIVLDASQAEFARTAKEDARTALGRLRDLVADNPTQSQRLADLTRQLDVVFAGHDEVLRLMQRGAAGEVRSAVAAQIDLAPQMRQSVREITDEETRLLAQRDVDAAAAMKRLAILLVVIFAAAVGCALVAVLALVWQLRAGARRYAELEHAKQETDAANRALGESERRLETILDNAGDAILVVDGTGLVQVANPACGHLFGVDPSALLARPIADLIPGTSAESGRPDQIVQGKRSDGSLFPAEFSRGTLSMDGAEATVYVLRDATERQRLDALKSEFVSTVSHELRTPLTSIRGSLGLIVAGAAGVLPDKAKALLDIAHKNSERLVGLVNDILDIEKIESGRMELRRDRLEVGSLLDQAIDMNQAYAAQHEVEYWVSARPEMQVPVMGDADRLIQVLTNLLSNAAKFSPPGAVVDVAFDVIGSRVRISVRDHGAGIPEAFRGRIFQRFAQADSSDARQKGGTGLGLSITKAIVERHGGQIGFEAAEGGGTRFWFTLPLLAGAPADAPAGDAQRRVLVCEDDPDVATLIAMMIEQDGWGVDIAHDAETALAKARARRYDAMTIDLLLPGMDGIALIRNLRTDPTTAELPIVVVSAVAEDGRRVLNGGAVHIVDWLNKPIEQLRLRAALRQAGLRRRNGRARILHVEDDDDVIAVVGAIVRDEAEIIPARSLKEGQQRLAEGHYDLVIIDVGLPDGSGLDLLETINARTPREPVLIFSAQDTSGALASAVSASLVKSRTDNEQLHRTITGLIDGLIQDQQEAPRHAR
ncbi:response regulator [Inquilinus sp. OTU3971]|uniref:response regulator n=1 Tax=Inquilinus sp. OTU3971 TaxID=3043855 RepID=UPI00313DE503